MGRVVGESNVEYKWWNQEVMDLNAQRLEEQKRLNTARAEEKSGGVYDADIKQEKAGGIADEDGDEDEESEWDSDEDDDDDDEDAALGGMTMSAGLMRMLGMDVPDEEESTADDWVPPSHAGLDNSRRLI